MPEFIEVDPAELHLPPSRSQGADPGKLARQIAKHGRSLDEMPAIQVTRGRDGRLRINDGVTRATRAAKLCPGGTGARRGHPRPECGPDPAGEGRSTMIEPDPRTELWAALAELSRRYPAWRLGQLIANVADWSDQGVWDVEDADLLRVARRHLAQLAVPAPDRVHA
jgi:hypothetical protein